jgi:hypothetical protein
MLVVWYKESGNKWLYVLFATGKYLFLHAGAITWSEVYQWNCVIMPRYLELKEATRHSLSFMPYLFEISVFLLTIFLAVNALYT